MAAGALFVAMVFIIPPERFSSIIVDFWAGNKFGSCTYKVSVLK